MSDWKTWKLLHGEELLKKGQEKTERTLPNRGPKEVAPSKSWVEAKQIQEALETRKNLLSVERVEKWGAISHAEWDNEKRVARVTELRGGHWSYLGHSAHKQTYLHPEEALFMMELSALRLTYEGVPVSLQQAYALLLNENISIREYKVFSELGRVGYKVMRTTIKTSLDSEGAKDVELPEKTDKDVEDVTDKTDKDLEKVAEKMDKDVEEVTEKTDKDVEKVAEKIDKDVEDVTEKIDKDVEEVTDQTEKAVLEHNNDEDMVDSAASKDGADVEKEIITRNNATKTNCANVDQEIITAKASEEQNNSENALQEPDSDVTFVKKNTESEQIEIDKTKDDDILEIKVVQNIESSKEDAASCDDVEMVSVETVSDTTNENWRRNPLVMVMGPSQSTGHLQTSRQNAKQSRSTIDQHNKFPKYPTRKSLCSLQLPNYFQAIDEVAEKDTVTVAAPAEEHLPRNVFLFKTQYTLKMDEIRNRKASDGASLYEMEGANRPNENQPQIRDDPIREAIMQQQRVHHQQRQKYQFFIPAYFRFMQQNFARNMAFQRFGFASPFANQYLRFNPFLRHPIFPMQTVRFPTHAQSHSQNDATRKWDHLQAIRRIAVRIRNLKLDERSKKVAYLSSLKNLIAAYNQKYGANLELSDSMTLKNDCDNIETVQLDDDEPPAPKRKRSSEQPRSDKDVFLGRLKVMAGKLKEMRHSGTRCFRNRRSLLDAIKLYNGKFGMNIVLNEEFEIVDRKQIVLDSSSDSDCVITDESMLEKDTESRRKKKTKKAPKSTVVATKTSQPQAVTVDTSDCNDFYTNQASNFSKWLPSKDDFGRAEVPPAVYCQHRLINSNQDTFVFDYIGGLRDDTTGKSFRDWHHLKTDFWTTVERTALEAEEACAEIPPSSVEPLLSTRDGLDFHEALERVRIIKSFAETTRETKLRVAFDAFDRDVKHFKKSDVPVPTFRVVCVDEDAPTPPVSEVLSLGAPYGDGAPLLLAVVGASVAYVLITPADLPVNSGKGVM